MNTQQDYRDTLEALRLKIKKELELIATKDGETGDWEATPDKTEQFESDENSEADASESLASQTAVVQDLQTTYRNIEIALAKISNNTFGFCEICSEPIEATRLAFLPSARTCITHKDEERTLSL